MFDSTDLETIHWNYPNLFASESGYLNVFMDQNPRGSSRVSLQKMMCGHVLWLHLWCQIWSTESSYSIYLNTYDTRGFNSPWFRWLPSSGYQFRSMLAIPSWYVHISNKPSFARPKWYHDMAGFHSKSHDCHYNNMVVTSSCRGQLWPIQIPITRRPAETLGTTSTGIIYEQHE